MKIKTELGDFKLPDLSGADEFSTEELNKIPERLVQASKIFDIPVFRQMAVAWVKTPVKLDFDNYLINLISDAN